MRPSRIVVGDFQVWFDGLPGSRVVYWVSQLQELFARSVVQLFIHTQTFHWRVASPEEVCNPILDFLLGVLPLRNEHETRNETQMEPTV